MNAVNRTDEGHEATKLIYWPQRTCHASQLARTLCDASSAACKNFTPHVFFRAPARARPAPTRRSRSGPAMMMIRRTRRSSCGTKNIPRAPAAATAAGSSTAPRTPYAQAAAGGHLQRRLQERQRLSLLRRPEPVPRLRRPEMPRGPSPPDNVLHPEVGARLRPDRQERTRAQGSRSTSSHTTTPKASA